MQVIPPTGGVSNLFEYQLARRKLVEIQKEGWGNRVQIHFKSSGFAPIFPNWCSSGLLEQNLNGPIWNNKSVISYLSWSNFKTNELLFKYLMKLELTIQTQLHVEIKQPLGDLFLSREKQKPGYERRVWTGTWNRLLRMYWYEQMIPGSTLIKLRFFWMSAVLLIIQCMTNTSNAGVSLHVLITSVCLLAD